MSNRPYKRLETKKQVKVLTWKQNVNWKTNHALENKTSNKIPILTSFRILSLKAQ